MEKVDITRSEVKLNWAGLSSNPKRWKEFKLGANEKGMFWGAFCVPTVGCHFFPILLILTAILRGCYSHCIGKESKLRGLFCEGKPLCPCPARAYGGWGGPAWEEPRADVPLSALSCSHMVDLTPLVLNPGGFHFSYLAGNRAHQLHCSGYPW